MIAVILKTSKWGATLISLKHSNFNFIASRSVRNNRYNNLKIMVNAGELMKEYSETNHKPDKQRGETSQARLHEIQSYTRSQPEEEPLEFPKFKKDPKLSNDVEEKIQDCLQFLEFPSDCGQFVQKVRELTPERKKSYAPKKKIDPATTSILLFPGQGSQFVGMGKNLLHIPKAMEMYNIASHILGFDLLKVCLNGPAEVLNKTQNSQAAVVVASLAAAEKLKIDQPLAIENCVATAGYSVGEISALAFSGALSFEDAISLVKVRSEQAQNVCNSINSAMMSVRINKDSRHKFACLSAIQFCSQELKMEDPVCEVSNHLYGGLKVISGNAEALEFIARNAKAFNIHKCVYLPVSGAFHSRLMKPASVSIWKTMNTLKVQKPTIDVYSNVTGEKFKNIDDIKQLTAKHIWKPVKWEQIMTNMYVRQQGEDFPTTYEVGPGKQLGHMLYKCNGKAFQEYISIGV